MLPVVDRENDQEFLAEVTHIYSESPEPGFNGYIEIEFIVVDNQKDITNQFVQDTLDDMEEQLLMDIASGSEV